jgi:hypothetical protein
MANRQRLALRFTHQQMNMFRHDNISENYEAISVAHAFEYFQEQVRAHGCEQRPALIATEGQEM